MDCSADEGVSECVSDKESSLGLIMRMSMCLLDRFQAPEEGYAGLF